MAALGSSGVFRQRVWCEQRLGGLCGRGTPGGGMVRRLLWLAHGACEEAGKRLKTSNARA